MKFVPVLLVAVAAFASPVAQAQSEGYGSMGQACKALRSSGLPRHPLGHNPCAYPEAHGFGGNWDIYGRPYTGLQDPRYQGFPVAAEAPTRVDPFPLPYSWYPAPGYANGAPRALVDRDGDGIEDGRDQDRDGDGVRNSRDRYPDDPRYR